MSLNRTPQKLESYPNLAAMAFSLYCGYNIVELITGIAKANGPIEQI